MYPIGVIEGHPCGYKISILIGSFRVPSIALGNYAEVFTIDSLGARRDPDFFIFLEIPICEKW